MAKNPIETSTSNPCWFTPKRLLMVCCVINMLSYVGRGAIASNGVNGGLGTCSESGICTSNSGIQGDFNLNNFQDGILSSAFMVGLLVASPIFASLAKSHNPFRLIGVGLSVWTFATAGCGISFDFWSITFGRMLVGVGEALSLALLLHSLMIMPPLLRKLHGLQCFTCAYHLELHWAMFMVELLEAILIGVMHFGVRHSSCFLLLFWDL